jgi:cell division protein FtsL
MTLVRANLLLSGLLVVCALGLVTSQHKARRMVTQHEHEMARSRTLDVEFGQLQLEQSTQAMHARVERIAAEKLRMRPTDPSRTVILQGVERK